MTVIIRLQNLPWSATAVDIRRFFARLSIPDGGVHIVGGDWGDAFIAFSADEDARQAMMLNGKMLLDNQVSLLLSSKAEMQSVIAKARELQLARNQSPQDNSQYESSQTQPQNNANNFHSQEQPDYSADGSEEDSSMSGSHYNKPHSDSHSQFPQQRSFQEPSQSFPNQRPPRWESGSADSMNEQRPPPRFRGADQGPPPQPFDGPVGPNQGPPQRSHETPDQFRGPPNRPFQDSADQRQNQRPPPGPFDEPHPNRRPPQRPFNEQNLDERPPRRPFNEPPPNQRPPQRSFEAGGRPDQQPASQRFNPPPDAGHDMHGPERPFNQPPEQARNQRPSRPFPDSDDQRFPPKSSEPPFNQSSAPQRNRDNREPRREGNWMPSGGNEQSRPWNQPDRPPMDAGNGPRPRSSRFSNKEGPESDVSSGYGGERSGPGNSFQNPPRAESKSVGLLGHMPAEFQKEMTPQQREPNQPEPNEYDRNFGEPPQGFGDGGGSGPGFREDFDSKAPNDRFGMGPERDHHQGPAGKDESWGDDDDMRMDFRGEPYGMRGRPGRGRPMGRGPMGSRPPFKEESFDRNTESFRGGRGRGGPPRMGHGFHGDMSEADKQMDEYRPPMRDGPSRGGPPMAGPPRGSPSRGGPSRGGPSRGRFGGDLGHRGDDFGPREGNLGHRGGDFGGMEGEFGPQGEDFGPRDGDFGHSGGDFGPRDGDFGPRDEDFGPRDGDFGPRDRGFGPRDRGFGPRDGGFGPRDGGLGPRDGGFGPRDGGFGPRDGGFGPRGEGSGPRDGGFGPRDGGFGPRDEGFGPRDGGLGPRDEGFGPRDEGFGRRDEGFGPRDGDFGPRDGDFGPRDGAFGPGGGDFGPRSGGLRGTGREGSDPTPPKRGRYNAGMPGANVGGHRRDMPFGEEMEGDFPNSMQGTEQRDMHSFEGQNVTRPGANRDTSFGGPGMSRKRGWDEDIDRFILVENLPTTISYREVRRFLGGCEIPRDGLKLINNEEGDRIGLAYIMLATKEACRNALEKDGQILNGNSIKISPCSAEDFECAVDSYLPPNRSRRGDDNSSRELPKDNCIEILNIPYRASEIDVKRFLSSCETAENGGPFILTDESGRSRGSAVVKLNSHRDFKEALNLHRSMLMDRTANIRYITVADFEDKIRRYTSHGGRRREYSSGRGNDSSDRGSRRHESGASFRSREGGDRYGGNESSSDRKTQQASSKDGSGENVNRKRDADKPRDAPRGRESKLSDQEEKVEQTNKYDGKDKIPQLLPSTQAPLKPTDEQKSPVKDRNDKANTEAGKQEQSDTAPLGEEFFCIKLEGVPPQADESRIRSFLGGLQTSHRGVHIMNGDQINRVAFVEFIKSEDCRKALDLNGKRIDNASITVTLMHKRDMLAQIKEFHDMYRNPRLSSWTPTAPQAPNMPTTERFALIRMTNVNLRAHPLDIVRHFEGFKIHPRNVRILTNPDGRPTGEATVRVESVAEAETIVKDINFRPLLGRAVQLTVQ